MSKQSEALLALYKWATGQDKDRNPYSYEVVCEARRALRRDASSAPSTPLGLPTKRPTGKVPGALYDLSEWSTSQDRRKNPYSYLAVRNANKALGGNGYNLPEELKELERHAKKMAAESFARAEAKNGPAKRKSTRAR